MSNNFQFGIEEEYFIVDAETKAVQRRMPTASSSRSSATSARRSRASSCKRSSR